MTQLTSCPNGVPWAILILLSARASKAQTATQAASTSGASISTESTSGSTTSSSSTDCSSDGSVTDYLSCEKAKFSTTTLVSVGLAVIFGIFLLAWGGVWYFNRRRRTLSELAAGREDGPGVEDERKPSGGRVQRNVLGSEEEEEEEEEESEEEEEVPEKVRKEREAAMRAQQEKARQAQAQYQVHTRSDQRSVQVQQPRQIQPMHNQGQRPGQIRPVQPMQQRKASESSTQSSRPTEPTQGPPSVPLTTKPRQDTRAAKVESESDDEASEEEDDDEDDAEEDNSSEGETPRPTKTSAQPSQPPVQKQPLYTSKSTSSLSHANAQAKPIQKPSTSETDSVGSPRTPQPRTLYPSNPSPSPRHLQNPPRVSVHSSHSHSRPGVPPMPPPSGPPPVPPTHTIRAVPPSQSIHLNASGPPTATTTFRAPTQSAMRQSAYGRSRDSIASVHFTNSSSDVALPIPVAAGPMAAYAAGHTRPLDIRKSAVPSIAIANSGSPNSRPPIRPTEPRASKQSTRRPFNASSGAGVAEVDVPALPGASGRRPSDGRPGGDRRPSEASGRSQQSQSQSQYRSQDGHRRPSQGRRPSDRGQMI